MVCSGLHTQRLHPQLGVLRDVWPVPSAHWGLAGASPDPWPCPASVSMWTPGCTGGQGRPAANTGSWRWSLIRPQPCPGNRLQSPPSLPRGGPAHGSQTRDEPRLPGYVVPVAALQLGHRTTSRLLLAVLCLQESRLLWKAFCCGDGVGRAAWVGRGARGVGLWRAGLASPHDLRACPGPPGSFCPWASPLPAACARLQPEFQAGSGGLSGTRWRPWRPRTQRQGQRFLGNHSQPAAGAGLWGGGPRLQGAWAPGPLVGWAGPPRSDPGPALRPSSGQVCPCACVSSGVVSCVCVCAGLCRGVCASLCDGGFPWDIRASWLCGVSRGCLCEPGRCVCVCVCVCGSMWGCLCEPGSCVVCVCAGLCGGVCASLCDGGFPWDVRAS